MAHLVTHATTTGPFNQPDQFQTPRSRWLALTHRTPSSHSSFFYGVKSTKVYCRPTCNARLARRANVIFYDTAEQAQRDGYRPCKRCKPDDLTFRGDGEELVLRVLALLQEKMDDPGMKRDLKTLAAEVGVSPSYLCRVFKKTMGITLGMYMREFEKDAPERELHTVSVPQSLNWTSPSEMGASSTPTTPADMTMNPGPLADGSWKEWPKEQTLEMVEETLDLDFDYEAFDAWFRAQDFSTDDLYR